MDVATLEKTLIHQMYQQEILLHSYDRNPNHLRKLLPGILLRFPKYLRYPLITQWAVNILLPFDKGSQLVHFDQHTGYFLPHPDQ